MPKEYTDPSSNVSSCLNTKITVYRKKTSIATTWASWKSCNLAIKESCMVSRKQEQCFERSSNYFNSAKIYVMFSSVFTYCSYIVSIQLETSGDFAITDHLRRRHCWRCWGWNCYLLQHSLHFKYGHFSIEWCTFKTKYYTTFTNFFPSTNTSHICIMLIDVRVRAMSFNLPRAQGRVPDQLGIDRVRCDAL